MRNISETAMNMIKISCERLKLNQRDVDILAKETPYDIIPIKSSNQRAVFEYALALNIKRLKGDYADFVRALTPLVADLIETILLMQCKININDYCKVNHKGVRNFDEAKLKGTKVYEILQGEFKGEFKTGMVGTRQMVPIINAFSDDLTLNKKVTDIMEVERNIRNLTAHEIVSVTREWIKKKSGFTIEQIVDIVKYLIGKVGINASRNAWESYDVMNQYIFDELG